MLRLSSSSQPRISKRRSGSTDGGGCTCLIDAMNTTNLHYIVIWQALEAKSDGPRHGIIGRRTTDA